MATPSISTTFPSNPTTPPYPDDVEWITAYLKIHVMSDNSRRYGFVLWIIVLLVYSAFAILHRTGSRGGFIGAHWSKWSLRRRTWRGKHTLKLNMKPGVRRQPTSLPPNGQLLCLAILFVAILILAFVGPDYIAPTASVLSWRPDVAPSAVAARASAFDPSQFLQFQPQYTIDKAWWTVGGRTGLIAFAIFPLCVLFALKAPPFALFALPFTTQMHFDKLAWLHRWSGRFIWLITALHVLTWSIQLFRDNRSSTGMSAYHYAWKYEKFIYGWIAFSLLTLIILLSAHPLRKNHYEIFYFLHVLIIPLTLITAALHHPPVWWWCWGALALWAGERIWRATWWFYQNGIFTQLTASPSISPGYPSRGDFKQLKIVAVDSYPPQSPSGLYSRLGPEISPASTISYTPPPGFAHAELLSGATVRLTFISPGFVSWAPGQHFLINIPSVSKVKSHPFTTASICDEQSPSEAGRAIVMLIRAKDGWTLNLWDHVVLLFAHGQRYSPRYPPPKGTDIPAEGVLLRMYVDGPFGSSVRAHWGLHSTVLVVAGGSGVSFGVSILHYICLCLAGRDGRYLGGRRGGRGLNGFATKRVRFVWIVREFGHIQWCASVIRQCLEMIPPPGLEINIFVTNTKEPPPDKGLPPPAPEVIFDKSDSLAPPSPGFAHGKNRSTSDSMYSIDSNASVDSLIDRSEYTREYGDEERDIGELGIRESYTLDLTNFDGDKEVHLPGEDTLNLRIKKAGKLRRAKSRQAAQMLAAKGEPIPADHRTGFYQLDDSRDQRASTDSTEELLSWNPKPGFGHRRSKSSVDSDMGASMPLEAGVTLHTRQTSSPLSSPSSPAFPKQISSGPYQSHPLQQNPPHPSSPSRPVSSLGVPQTRADRRASSLSQSWNASSEILTLPALPDGNQVRLLVNERELDDMSVVSEHARPGKPKLDRILADEVQRSRGSVIVAYCGPTSLNAMVRKVIAAQIDPDRIRRGDRSGHIDLVSEEFQY